MSRESMTEVTEINDENYEKAVNDNLPCIIDHFADWCGPCKLLTPVFEKLSGSYKGRLNFWKVDTEAFPDIAVKNSVFSIPCLIVFHNGREVERIIGYMNEAKLKEAIDNILKRVM